MHRGDGGSKNGSKAMERNGTVWDCTRVQARDYSAQWDCTGLSGTQRRDLQNRRLQVRFLSHLPENPEFMGLSALWLQRNVCALTPF